MNSALILFLFTNPGSVSFHLQRWLKLWWWSLFTVTLLGQAGCATNPVTGKQDFVLLSEQQEIETGTQYHQQILKQYALYEDPDLGSYVTSIGKRLASHSHREGLEFHFYVLDSPMVNAFALPGGYVYITRGILAYMDNEAQLAGVLGHEIGHVTARHGVRQQSRGTIIGILGSAAAAATGSGAVGDLSNMLGSALMQGYGRSHELEADRLGAEYLARSGYSPQVMIDVIGILKDQELYEIDRARADGRRPAVYHGVFSSHPDNDRRLQEVIAAAEVHTAERPRTTSRVGFLNRLKGIAYGPSESQGVLVNGNFMHRDLDVFISLPRNWKSENRPDRLISVSPKKDAFIQILLDSRGTEHDAEAYLRKQFDNLRQAESFNINGLRGFAGIASISTPFGNRDSRLAAVLYKDWVFVVAGVHRDQILRNPFETTVNSIRPLTGEEREQARGKKIHLVRTVSGDTYEKLAARNGLDQKDVDTLRLLNGDYPAGNPAGGSLIKILR